MQLIAVTLLITALEYTLRDLIHTTQCIQLPSV
jgi:hypothetical protein